MLAENAVWTYEDPYPAMEAIRELLAFYPEPGGDLWRSTRRHDPEAVREAVEHTDDGAGAQPAGTPGRPTRGSRGDPSSPLREGDRLVRRRVEGRGCASPPQAPW